MVFARQNRFPYLRKKTTNMEEYAVIVAGGKGSRMNQELPKQFIELQGEPILMHTLRQFYRANTAINIVLVLPEVQRVYWQQLVTQHAFDIPHQVVSGGKSRFQSVKNGLTAISSVDGLVAIHDGVRPFISEAIIKKSFAVAKTKGNAVVSMPLKDSIRHLSETGNTAMPRQDFRIIQTPQTFQLALIKAAFKTEELSTFTDDATVLEHFGHSIELIDGDYRNIKITTPEDLEVATVFSQHFQVK